MRIFMFYIQKQKKNNSNWLKTYRNLHITVFPIYLEYINIFSVYFLIKITLTSLITLIVYIMHNNQC